MKTYCHLGVPSVSSDWSPKQDFTTGPLRMGDESLQQISFQIYPNPVIGDNDLTIKIGNDDVGKVKIKIFNASGMLIDEFRPASTSVHIPIGRLTKSSGIYFLRALKGQASFTERVLVLGK